MGSCDIEAVAMRPCHIDVSRQNCFTGRTKELIRPLRSTEAATSLALTLGKNGLKFKSCSLVLGTASKDVFLLVHKCSGLVAVQMGSELLSFSRV